MRNLVVSLILLWLLGFLLFDIYKKRTTPITSDNIVQVVIPKSSSASSIEIISSTSSLEISSSSSTTSSSEISSSSSSFMTQADYIWLYNRFQTISTLPTSNVVENWTTLQWLWTSLNPTTKIFVTNDRNYAYIVWNSWNIIKKILAPWEKQFTKFWVNWNILSLSQLINTNSSTQITINDYNINNWDLVESRSFNVSAEDVESIAKN